MLPFCRPADSSGYTKIFVLADVSAMTAWVDYIPVQAAAESAPVANRVEALGYQEVNSLADATGLTAFVDYIPVSLVTGRTLPWNTDAVNGYIPVFNKVGSLGGASSDWGLVATWGTLSATDVMDVASDRAKGLTFNDDGTKLYYCDDGDDSIYYGTCSTAYDPSTYTNVGTFDDLANALWTQIQWSDDGTYFFVSDQFSDDIERFTCSTPYDLSTAATPHGQTWDYRSSGDSNDDNICWTFKADGTKLFMWCGDKADAGVTKTLFSYSLGTAWDLTTVTKDGGTAIAGSVATAGGMAISPDGKIIYVRFDVNNIGQIDMSTGFDYTTASLNASNLEMSSLAPVASQIFMNPDADKLFVLNDDGASTSIRTLTVTP